MNLFSGFWVGSSNFVTSHLQYAYDTFISGDVTVKNLLIIKAILRVLSLL